MRKKIVSILVIVLFVIIIIVKIGASKNTNNVTHTTETESNKQQIMTEETDDVIEETPCVEFRNVTFGYDEQVVLNHVDFRIFHMFSGTVRDQITLYDDSISEEQVQAVAKLTGLSEAIQELEQGFETLCTSELFSQGQWQLLSIARAAVAEPSMLLLDEITANLDAETETAVLHALKRVAENRTVISISHRTSAEMGRIIEV